MRKLQDQIGAVTPNADYPKGAIANNQTLISEGVNGDFIQFFQKLVIDAGITENDLPDNVTNGYQLIDALIGGITKYKNPWINVDNADLLSDWEKNATLGFFQYRKTAFNKLEIRCRLENGTGPNVWRVPVEFRPPANTYIYLGNNAHKGCYNCVPGEISINPDGYLRVTANIDTPTGNSVYDKVGFNISYSIDW